MAKLTYVLSALIVLSSLLCEVEARIRIYVPVATTLSAGIIAAIVVSVLVFVCLLGTCLIKCLSSGSRGGRVINPHPPVTVVQPHSFGQTADYRSGGAEQFNNCYGNAKMPEPPPYSQPSASPPVYLDPAYPPVNARTPASTFGQSTPPRGTLSPRNLATAGSTSPSLFPPGSSASQRPTSGATAPVAPSTSGAIPSARGAVAPPGTAGSNRPHSVAPTTEGFASISSPWS